MLANIPMLRKEALLAHVEELVGELHDAPVYYLRNRQQLAGRGISRSAISHVAAYLQRHRDLEALGQFVDRLHQLDETTAPNQENPKAEHRALRALLRDQLKKRPELTADEWIYVLSWARRHAPARTSFTPSSKGGNRTKRRIVPSEETEVPAREPGAFKASPFGALGALKSRMSDAEKDDTND